ncbi:hypothetical protein [Candidatus Neptunichlamydia sp. REUL1]|uniref:hypothetical protein n=1 Tax=Candidatus Neptunichlamydia sp. REUL1 TaxID=3064277 RepID=UPI0029313B4B|nr:hypothetical protein [Candidatus Neptunochlamydia sp. REUL1]
MQKRTIISVLEKFRLQVNPHRLNDALNNFWGKSITFNKGTIGQWKKEYKHFHVEMFKEKWNKYLINWKYETDYDWNFNYCLE